MGFEQRRGSNSFVFFSYFILRRLPHPISSICFLYHNSALLAGAVGGSIHVLDALHQFCELDCIPAHKAEVTQLLAISVSLHIPSYIDPSSGGFKQSGRHSPAVGYAIPPPFPVFILSTAAPSVCPSRSSRGCDVSCLHPGWFVHLLRRSGPFDPLLECGHRKVCPCGGRYSIRPVIQMEGNKA